MTREIRPSEECGSDSAAYVLGALEPDGAEAYRSHLTQCADCRDEVAMLQRVADLLPMGAPQYRVPADLRRRVVGAVRGQSRPRKPAFVPALVAAAAALVIAVIAFASITTRDAAGPRLLPATVVGSTGNAQLRIGAGHAELLVRHLSPPSAGRIYEVWLKRPSAAPAPTTALFSVTADGAADIGVPGGLRGVSEILVTEEPAGGSRVPTGPPVIVAPTS